MHRTKLPPTIHRRASNTNPQRVSQSSRLIVEKARVMRRCQRLQKRSHPRRQPVVHFVAGGPEGVAACWGQGVDLEPGVIGGHALEADVGVPGR